MCCRVVHHLLATSNAVICRRFCSTSSRVAFPSVVRKKFIIWVVGNVKESSTRVLYFKRIHVGTVEALRVSVRAGLQCGYPHRPHIADVASMWGNRMRAGLQCGSAGLSTLTPHCQCGLDVGESNARRSAMWGGWLVHIDPTVEMWGHRGHHDFYFRLLNLKIWDIFYSILFSISLGLLKSLL